MKRAIRQGTCITLATIAVLLLAGCVVGPGPDTPECMDVLSGSLSDDVKVDGDFGMAPTAAFDLPVQAEELERTVVREGDGETTVPGTHVSAVVSLYSGGTGEQLLAQPMTVTGGDYDAFRAAVDCVPTGSRTVTVAPSTALYDGQGNGAIGLAPGDTVVIVADVQEPLEPRQWTEDVPEVAFGAAAGAAPVVTLPAAEPPVDLLRKVLEQGEGEEVQAGDTVTMHYQGTSWDSGEVFEQSYGGQAPILSTDGLVPGLAAAVIGQKPGAKLIVTIPPQFAYGTRHSELNPLAGQTLVYVIEVESVESVEPTE